MAYGQRWARAVRRIKELPIIYSPFEISCHAGNKPCRLDPQTRALNFSTTGTLSRIGSPQSNLVCPSSPGEPARPDLLTAGRVAHGQSMVLKPWDAAIMRRNKNA